MSQEELERNAKQQDGEGQPEKSIDHYPPELVQAIETATFTTLAVASGRGFTDLKIRAVRKIAEDVYAVRFTYSSLCRVEKVDGWVTEKILTKSQGLYIHQFAPALYLDAYTMSTFVQDLVNPPPQD